MTDLELRDIFKYKKFKLSADNSELFFTLDQVWKNGKCICNYYLKADKSNYIMTFEPDHFGPFLNIWVIPENSGRFIINMQADKLSNGDTITLSEIPKEQIHDDMEEK